MRSFLKRLTDFVTSIPILTSCRNAITPLAHRFQTHRIQRTDFDKPPQQRVRHKVWRKHLADATRQLKLGAGRARQTNALEMLDGAEVMREVQAAGTVDK